MIRQPLLQVLSVPNIKSIMDVTKDVKVKHVLAIVLRLTLRTFDSGTQWPAAMSERSESNGSPLRTMLEPLGELQDSLFISQTLLKSRKKWEEAPPIDAKD